MSGCVPVEAVWLANDMLEYVERVGITDPNGNVTRR